MPKKTTQPKTRSVLDCGSPLPPSTRSETKPGNETMTCPKCDREINLAEDVVPEFAQVFKADTEFRFTCKCGQSFYTFVNLDWIPFEN
jgi:hypothetical protein